MKTLSAPISVCFGITNKCNLNCRHCLASNTKAAQDLTTKEILGIIDQMKDMRVLNVSLFGGEPLMREDFFIILERLAKSRADINLNTNGTLINRNLAKRLAESSIKAYALSLDGSCPEVHDPFRGKGSFNNALKGLKNLLEHKRKAVISCTVTRFNFNDMENIALLGEKLGAISVRFNDVMYIGNAACYHKDLVMTAPEKAELLNRARQIKKRFGGFVTGSVIQTCEIIDNSSNSKENFPLKIHNCGAATTKCAIRPDGKVMPCEILWETAAGDLKEQSLKDIWINSPVMNLFRQTIEIKEDEIPECRDCGYLRLCYKGHRCQPYYYPGARFEHKELYCWREDVIGAR